ncbi:MAG: chorismate synthase [Candidatus Omnitrophica bacterium]|nr:chorismate synthase [Candidatus Omnitrophota bacterium]
MMRILTAGESHGACNIAIIEGFPKGVRLEESIINKDLLRRMHGAGRGKRMALEQDQAKIIAGLRNKFSLGSPIALLIANKDNQIFSQKKDLLKSLNVPRPAHADLSGSLKYQEKDIRNILERASARETVARVACGSVCKQFLSNFGISFASFTVSVGQVYSGCKPKNTAEILSKTKKSKLNCIDPLAEEKMIDLINECADSHDTLGGIVELWIDGLVAGIGNMMHFDRRLDAKLASGLMSIPAVKGVEVGLGFDYAKQRGSKSHDAIYYSSSKGFYRKTNNSGGIEGGLSTGEPVVLRLAMKPIATLTKPLESVNMVTKRKAKAPSVRSDTCAIAALGPISESMAAISVFDSFLEKFGSDSLKEIQRSYLQYKRNIHRFK